MEAFSFWLPCFLPGAFSLSRQSRSLIHQSYILALSSNRQLTYRLVLSTCCVYWFRWLLCQFSWLIYVLSQVWKSISSRNFASSSFASCSRLSSYCSLFHVFRNDKLTSFFSFYFRVCSSLWFFNSLSSAIVLIYELNFSSKSVLTACASLVIFASSALNFVSK